MRKNTKKALLLSCLSLLLCVSMLVGTTFAWFTDTDTTAVANVVTGTLDIEIVDAEGAVKNDGLKFRNVGGSTDILWEPGATFRTEGFALKNMGSLALKYKLLVNNTEVSYNKLNEVIDFSLVKADGTVIDLSTMKDLALAPNGGSSDVMYIQGTMDQNAGNEYQNLTLSAVGITVAAAQYTSEKDMTDNTYDASAEYAKIEVANTQEELNAALTGAGDKPVNVTLPAGDFKLPSMNGNDVTFTGTKDTVVDMSKPVATNNSDVTLEGVTVKFADNATYTGIQHTDTVVYKDCTIYGTQFLYADAEFVNCTFINETNAYCVWTYGAPNVTFTDCTFQTGGKAILVYTEGEHHATITVNNCKFTSNDTATGKAVVEVGSSPKSDDTTYNIYINNCTETGFDLNPEGKATNSTLWGNKDSMDQAHLNVVINGTDVY